MSYQNDRSTSSKGCNQRPRRGLHYRWRETSVQQLATGQVEERDDDEIQDLREEDHRPRHSSPRSLSRASTLVNEHSPQYAGSLHGSASQLSLARPLEEASYSLPPSPLESRPPSLSSSSASTELDSNSQHSLARPLEEAAYPQNDSPSWSEPASTQATSTRSSGPYMPPAYLRYRLAARARSQDDLLNATCPSAISLMAAHGSIDIPQAAESQHAASIPSVVPTPEGRDYASDASPSSSLLVEANDDMPPSRHTLAGPFGEAPFAYTRRPTSCPPAPFPHRPSPQACPLPPLNDDVIDSHSNRSPCPGDPLSLPADVDPMAGVPGTTDCLPSNPPTMQHRRRPRRPTWPGILADRPHGGYIPQSENGPSAGVTGPLPREPGVEQPDLRRLAVDRGGGGGYYPLSSDVELEPSARERGSESLIWERGGGSAERVTPPPCVAAAQEADRTGPTGEQGRLEDYTDNGNDGEGDERVNRWLELTEQPGKCG